MGQVLLQMLNLEVNPLLLKDENSLYNVVNLKFNINKRNLNFTIILTYFIPKADFQKISRILSV